MERKSEKTERLLSHDDEQREKRGRRQGRENSDITHSFGYPCSDKHEHAHVSKCGEALTTVGFARVKRFAIP